MKMRKAEFTGAAVLAACLHLGSTDAQADFVGALNGTSISSNFETGNIQPLPAHGWTNVSGGARIFDIGELNGALIGNDPYDNYGVQYDTGVPAAAGTTYTLHFDMGFYAGLTGGSANYSFELGTLNGGTFTPLAPAETGTVTYVANLSTPPSGVISGTDELVFSTGTTVSADPLAVRWAQTFQAGAETGASDFFGFDNVTLSTSYFWDINGQNAPGAGGPTPAGAWDGVAANFNTDLTGGSAGTMRAATSAGSDVVFTAGADGTGAYTVTVSGTQAARSVQVARGTVTLAGGTIATNTFNVATGSAANVSSVISGGTNGRLTKTGAGTLTLTGTNTHANGTTVSAGRLNAGSAGALGTGGVVVAAGAVLGVSTVDTAANLTQRPVIATLANNGLVDVASGGLRITSGVNGAALRAQIISGRNNGAWNGATGITSSSAAASSGARQVGYVMDSATSATVAYAASGDTDLNREVNTDDILNILAAGKLDQNVDATWQEGDFNYDGRANTDDILDILAAGVLDTGPYTRTSSSANLVGTFPVNAKLIYNPANGNMRIDTFGFQVNGFNLQDNIADGINVFAGAANPNFPTGGLSTTNTDTKVSFATTSSPFTGVLDLGNIAVPGLSLADLLLQLNNPGAPLSSTDSYYTAQGVTGRQNLDIVPEPGAIGLAAMAGLGLLRRSRRRA